MSDLIRYASDASPYRFVPQVVVVPEDIDDVSAILSYARGKGREVVFRAAGTSLNGQAQGVTVRRGAATTRRCWNRSAPPGRERAPGRLAEQGEAGGVAPQQALFGLRRGTRPVAARA